MALQNDDGLNMWGTQLKARFQIHWSDALALLNTDQYTIDDVRSNVQFQNMCSQSLGTDVMPASPPQIKSCGHITSSHRVFSAMLLGQRIKQQCYSSLECFKRTKALGTDISSRRSASIIGSFVSRTTRPRRHHLNNPATRISGSSVGINHTVRISLKKLSASGQVTHETSILLPIKAFQMGHLRLPSNAASRQRLKLATHGVLASIRKRMYIMVVSVRKITKMLSTKRNKMRTTKQSMTSP